MDLRFIADHNEHLLSYFKLNNLTIDSLLQLTKDLFEILDDLNLDARAFRSFVYRLKLVTAGKVNEHEDDANDAPLRIGVTHRRSNRVFYFMLFRVPTNEDPVYRCESCGNQPFLQATAKDHVRQDHLS